MPSWVFPGRAPRDAARRLPIILALTTLGGKPEGPKRDRKMSEKAQGFCFELLLFDLKSKLFE
jgi:hypothetical protein